MPLATATRGVDRKDTERFTSPPLRYPLPCPICGRLGYHGLEAAHRSATSRILKTMEHTIGPINELFSAVMATLGEHVPRDLTWPMLVLMLSIATAIWFIRDGWGAKDADGRVSQQSLIPFLLPKEIYTHTSAKVDVGLYIVERFLHPLWAATFLVTVAPATESSVISTLNALWGSGPALTSHWGWMLLYSLLTLLVYDFLFYVIHYCEHKVPVLWAIHKIHHSAEVLTPLTRYREHIIEGPIYAIGAALAYGFAGGLFGWLFAGSIVPATLFNIGFFAVLFGFNGAFRHYHVAFHYPRGLSRWLQSPVMHHIHHSYLEEHLDTNLAAVTSLWDRLFGTLYIPEKDEYTPWGLGPATQSQYRSLTQNITGPFRDWALMLKARSKGNQTMRHE